MAAPELQQRLLVGLRGLLLRVGVVLLVPAELRGEGADCALQLPGGLDEVGLEPEGRRIRERVVCQDHEVAIGARADGAHMVDAENLGVP